MPTHTPAKRYRAVIYVADDADTTAAQAACLAHCERKGYDVVGLVLGDRAGRAYRDGVQTMAIAGAVDIVVINRRADLPAERLPRHEFVEEHQPPVKLPRQRDGLRRRLRPGPVDR